MSVASVEVLTEDVLAEAATVAREIDRQEAIYQTGKPLEEAMWSSFKMSSSSFAGRLDGELVVVWGVCALAPLEGIGQPWLVATPAIDRATFPFLRRCCYYLSDIKVGYDVLWNVVWEENRTAIGWLRWMGFEMKPMRKIGPYSKTFVPFLWTRSENV